DGPRVVLADALQHRGDVRGELIGLQVARPRGNATPQSRSREYELVSDAKRFNAWLSPISQGGDCLMQRGFAGRVTLNMRGIGSVAAHPAWATVTALAGLQQIPRKYAEALFDSCTSLNDPGIVD